MRSRKDKHSSIIYSNPRIINIRKNLKEFPEHKPLVYTPLIIGKIKLEKPIISDKLINDISKLNGRKKFINIQVYNALIEKEKQKNECNRGDNTPSLGKSTTERFYRKETYKENKKFKNTVSCFKYNRNKTLDNEKNNIITRSITSEEKKEDSISLLADEVYKNLVQGKSQINNFHQ